MYYISTLIFYIKLFIYIILYYPPSIYRQEAVVAAISEKDAHIALLENTPNSNQKNIDNVAKLTSHKLQLQKQLSDLVSLQ